MKMDCANYPVIGGQFAAHLTRVGLAVVLALSGIACTSAAIEGGGGAGGKSGGGGGNAGAGGNSGLVVKFDGGLTGTGGAAGTSGQCNSTSTAGCKAQAPEGCGDGINNQGGIEQCDDGNVVAGRRLQRRTARSSRTGPARRTPVGTCTQEHRLRRRAASAPARSATTATPRTATAATRPARCRIRPYMCDRPASPAFASRSAATSASSRARTATTATPRPATAAAHVQARGRLGLPDARAAVQGGPALRGRRRPDRHRRGVRRRQSERRRRLLGRLQDQGRGLRVHARARSAPARREVRQRRPRGHRELRRRQHGERRRLLARLQDRRRRLRVSRARQDLHPEVR